ncbi:unnamed protein product [Effrenium voratum]|nr:unnamed protein product [Effrenium voratum]CAJ1442298.1 unnamed protein product [Effrenium voratum]
MEGVRSPRVSVGVPTVLGGLDEVLYREAEERRQRQDLRERDALLALRQQSVPRLGRRSKACWHARLERELLSAFERCGTHRLMEMSQRRVLVLPRSGVHEVLRNLGFEAEVQFCGKLGVLLDREETGMICFDRLLHFIANATDTERAPPRPLSSLEEECFNQLEWQLSREFCQMLATRHSRATTESWRRRELCSESATPPGTPRNAAATTPRAATPRSRAATPRNGTPRSPSPGVARCHLLYHQAVFAARKGAQLEASGGRGAFLPQDEIKQLKLLKEMEECTFRPQLSHSKFRPPSRTSRTGAVVRNFESTVARLQAAHEAQRRQKAERERIPVGEKYEKLRRLGPEPFSCAGPRARVAPKPALVVFVDVKVRGRVGRVGVHEKEDVRKLARNFAKSFQLDAGAKARLEALLRLSYAWRAWARPSSR